MITKKISKQIRNISKKYSPIAAWALNDRLDNKKLSLQLLSFYRLGYGGVMVIPWASLPNKFMDSAWLNSVEFIVREAKKLNLDVWLWDDWCFPSGFGGGVVTREKRFRAKKLKILLDIVLEEGDRIYLPILPHTIAAGYFNIDKFNNAAGRIVNIDLKQRSFINHIARVRQRIIIVGWEYISAMEHTVVSHSRYLHPRDCDMDDIFTNDDRQTWSVDMLNPDATDLFIRIVHERYFKRLKNFFGTTIKGFFYDEPHLPSLLPWNENIPEEFLRKKGYDIFEHLISIVVEKKIYDTNFIQMEEQQTKKVRADYVDVWTDMVKENFYGKIHRWCKSHGVFSTGHHTGDESLCDIISKSGMFFKIMDESDIPGVDAVFKQIEPDKFNDTSRLAGSVKRIKDLPFALSESLAVMGHSVHPDFIRFVSDYQIVRGINKFLYKLSNYNPQKARYFHPPELGCTNPLIKNYGKKLFKRVSQICCIASGGSSGPKVCLYIPCNNYYMGEGNEIAKIIEDLARKLAYNQIEFDYVWEGSFNSYYIRDKKIVLGDEIYHCLIIPEKSKPSDSEMLLIKHLAEQGTAIISPEIFRLPGPNIRYSSCLDEIIDLLQEQIKAYSLSIKPKNLSISVLTRIYDSYQFYMLLNESAKSFNCKVKLRYQGNVYLMEQNSECLLPMGGNNIPLNFKPSETKILVLDTGSSKKIESARLKHRIKPKNWKLKLPSGEIVSIKEPFPLWNNLGYEGYSGFMDYYAEFICDKHINPAILELGTVYYCATCFIDNKKAGDAIFTPYRIILKNLSRGKHSLKIRVFNTPANEICGDKTRFRRLQQKGVFNGTYAPIYLSIDRKKIASGLLGKVRIYSIF